MRRTRLRPGRLVGLAVVLAGVLSGAPAQAQGVVETTLDNGLRVLLLEDHRTPIVTVQVWYRVGSRDEQVGRSGLSHFLEHMMFKGTPRFGPREYARLVEAQGGEQNAFTTRDATAYYVDVAADRVDLVLELEADRMQHLLLDPREVEAERKVILEERRSRTEDDPIGTLTEAFYLAAFTAHPYRLPVIGFAGDIRRLAAEDLRAWYRARYVPNNAILVAAGDFRAPALLERIRALFGPVPRGDDPPRPAVEEPEPRGPRRVEVRKEAQLPAIFLGYQVPNLRSPDAHPLEVLSTVLAGGRASRLHRRLVHGERLALEAGGDYSLLSVDPVPFTFYATPLPGRSVDELERALLAEVERLRTDLIDEEELQRAKNQIEAAFLFDQDSLHARASTLAAYELVGGFGLRDRFLPAIRAVTRDDVRRVVARYLVDDRRTTAVLAPVPPAATPAGASSGR